MAGNLTFNVDANDQASGTFAAVAAELKALGRELDKVDGRNVKAKVTINTPGAGAIAQLDQARAALAAIDGKNAKARVEITGVPDVATVRQLRATAKALREIDGQNATAVIAITGALPDPKALRAAARALKELQDVHEIAIHISITGAVDALAQVAALRRELRAIPAQTTTTVNVDVDKSLSSRLAGVGSALAKIGTLGGLAAAGLGSAVPAVATLAGSLTSLVGLAPLVVGGLASLVAVTATVKVGLKGVGDALKESDPKKYAESLKGLAPAASAFVTAYRQLKPVFDQVQLGTQQKLFDGLAKSFKQVALDYAPSLKSNLGGVATELNGVAKNVIAFASSSQTMRDVNTIFDNTRIALHNAAPAANNLLGAFRDIGTVGSEFLPQLGTGLTNVTQRFQDFIVGARESGQLKVWIQGGIDTLKTLGSVAGNVGSALGSIFKASKASGADFLTTLDKVTGKVAELLASAQGQSALTAFFKESRAAIDALLPGLTSLATGALQMIQSFSQTGGLQTFASTVSGIAQSLQPLLPMLGNLAGGVLRDLANGASIAATALSPIVGAVTGVVGALGPLPALVLASVVAFKLLASAAIAGSFAALSTRLIALAPAIATYAAGLTGSLAAGNAAGAAATRLGQAVGKVGAALPLIGVALIVAGSLYDQFAGKADEAATKVLNGSQSMQAAIAGEAAQIHKNQIEWLGGMNAQESYAAASKNVTAEVAKQRAEMGPMAQLQSDVARAQADLNDAVAQYSANSPQAAAAGATLAAAQGKLKTAQDGVADATKTATERLAEQQAQMQGQINAALGYAQAVQRTADAQKAANDALKAGGEKSAEYQGAVTSLAVAISSQADAAKKQGEALGGTEAGLQAYNVEILRATDLSTKAGRDAFGQLTDGLDDAGLAALSSTAKLSGLRTEIVTLPDGRKVTVVVDADRAKLDAVKKTAEEFVSKKYIGTVALDGDPRLFQDKILQSVTLADGTKATMQIDGNGAPLEVQIGASKYKIDATTGVMTIDGNPGPGEANLSGLVVHVDSATGVMTIDGDPTKANAKGATAKSQIDTSIGIITIDGNPTLANGKTTTAVTFADGSKGTITIDGNQTPANGKVDATVTYGNGKTSTIKVDAATGAANSSISSLVTRWNGYTIDINTVVSSRVGGLAGGGVIGFSGGGVFAPLRAAGGMVLPGYSPGRDTVPTMLSPGEGVLVPELVKQLGAGRIIAANREASGGRPGTNVGNIAGLMDGRIGRTSGPASVMNVRRGSGGMSSSTGSSGAADIALGLGQLRGDFQALAVEIRKQRPFTVEDRSGNPVETARATALALRLS